ncbi:secreted immunoglobulin domain 1 isoform X3 [Antennarius striatus]|uniref:secreted immunoglobulin domain 1 isoform X3 n=1 Tax=Antennarius striatus TaxID=241820 RepID=UPI0035B4AB92
MASALVCLMLLSVSGATVPPASTVKVRVGEDATLQCPLLDANSPSSRADPPTISWYRVAPGQSPQLLLSIRSTDVRPGPGGEAASPKDANRRRWGMMGRDAGFRWIQWSVCRSVCFFSLLQILVLI